MTDDEESRLVTALAMLHTALKRMLTAHDADVAAGSLIAAGNEAAAEDARVAMAYTDRLLND